MRRGVTWTGGLLCVLSAGLSSLGCSSSDEPPVAEPIPPQSGTFSALTYNVAGLPQGISGSEPELYMPLISPLLNGYELVLVQEDFSYHAELIAEVEHPYLSPPKEDLVKLVGDGLNYMSQWDWVSLDRQQWGVCYGDATTGAGDCLAEKGFSMSSNAPASTTRAPSDSSRC